MKHKLLFSAAWTLAAVSAAFSWDMAGIIKKVSENCDKIVTYTADAQVRYKI